MQYLWKCSISQDVLTVVTDVCYYFNCVQSHVHVCETSGYISEMAQNRNIVTIRFYGTLIASHVPSIDCHLVDDLE